MYRSNVEKEIHPARPQPPTLTRLPFASPAFFASPSLPRQLSRVSSRRVAIHCRSYPGLLGPTSSLPPLLLSPLPLSALMAVVQHSDAQCTGGLACEVDERTSTRRRRPLQ